MSRPVEAALKWPLEIYSNGSRDYMQLTVEITETGTSAGTKFYAALADVSRETQLMRGNGRGFQ